MIRKLPLRDTKIIFKNFKIFFKLLILGNSGHSHIVLIFSFTVNFINHFFDQFLISKDIKIH